MSGSRPAAIQTPTKARTSTQRRIRPDCEDSREVCTTYPPLPSSNIGRLNRLLHGRIQASRVASPGALSALINPSVTADTMTVEVGLRMIHMHHLCIFTEVLLIR